MKKATRKTGLYVASTDNDGSVMFRVDGKPYTLRKGTDIEVFINERHSVTFPASYMTLTLKEEGEVKAPKVEAKTEAPKVAPKSESKPKVAKKEIKEEVKEEPKVEAKKAPARGRKKSVKIETEEK